MDLFLIMMERGGLIILLAYLMVHLPAVKQGMTQPKRLANQWILFTIFAIFAIVANYTGVEIQEDFTYLNQQIARIQDQSSLANTRVLVIGVAGLISGPYVSLGVGAVSAWVRYLQGGVSPHIYVVSSLLVGACSGVIGDYLRSRFTRISVWQAAVTGLFMEIFQMICIFVLSADHSRALQLIQVIALPMIATNTLGTAIFISIINSSRTLEEQAKAIQTHDVLELANKTLPYLRKGLTIESCQPVARIIHEYMQVAAVSLTSTSEILAFVGSGEDHHVPSGKILTQLAKTAIQTGEILIARSQHEIDCDHEDCPLESAIVIPLKVKNQTQGTLKLYFSQQQPMTDLAQQLARGLGNVFSTQLALGQAEMAARLLQDSEIKSLQAQVNPHFLFNALNTISALIRMDAEKARQLVQDFSKFLRGNLQGARRNVIRLEDELAQVQAYLALENARFPNKVTLDIQVDHGLSQDQTLPPFTLQVLVENAYKHAFVGRKDGNQLKVRVVQMDGQCVIVVVDNGQGISPDRLDKLGKQTLQSHEGTGSALENLSKRLELLYGNRASLTFESTPQGTLAKVVLPLSDQQEGVTE